MTLAWKQIAVAFVFGACVGVVANRAYVRHRVHRPGAEAQFQQRLVNRLSAKLGLTPEQRTQVASIFEAKRQQLEALRAEITPQFEALRAATRAEIRQLLSPAQQQRFDVLEAAWEAKRKRFHHRWMGGAG